jgi:hypothetical protein
MNKSDDQKKLALLRSEQLKEARGRRMQEMQKAREQEEGLKEVKGKEIKEQGTKSVQIQYEPEPVDMYAFFVPSMPGIDDHKQPQR